jgi:hypothetical protein
MSKRSSLGSAYHYISVSLLSLVSFFQKKIEPQSMPKTKLRTIPTAIFSICGR